jgi:chitodextrinase
VFCGNTFATTPVSEGLTVDPRQACPDTTAPTPPTGLKATAALATSVGLTWTGAADDVGVTGYTVLRGGVQVGTTTTTSYTDPGLTAATAYTYTVVARDAAGNTSPASGPASVTTPAAQTTPTAQVVTVEAESGTLTAPMAVVADTKAQGGKYVAQTSGTTVGRDTITVNVPAAGRYALALRVIAPNSSSDSFTYAVDTGAATVFNLGTRTSWTWVTGPTLMLTAGQHRIVVSKRENGARLDAVRLTPAP